MQSSEGLRLKALLARMELSRRDLLEFTRWTKRDYQAAWFHRVLADAIGRWVRREVRRLMIFCPPRHGKSELVSRRLPAFIMGRHPDAQVLACSHGKEFAEELSLECQAVMDSEEYRALFPGTRLAAIGDVRNKRTAERWQVVGRKGTYRCAGVRSAIIGRGFDFGIIDDPFKDEMDAFSATVREHTYNWYTSTFRTRQAPDASILIMHQRWHDDDLAGRLLKLAAEDPEADQWEVISFPALREEMACAYDPRPIGEPLWPERYGMEFMAATRAGMPEYQWNALYQQRPTPKDGAVFKEQWFQRRFYRQGDFYHLADGRQFLVNACQHFVIVDPAASETNIGDDTGMGSFAMTPENDLLVLELESRWVSIDQIPSRVLLFCNTQVEQVRWVGCEDNGTTRCMYREIKRKEGMPAVKALKPLGQGKLERATEAIIKAQEGQIWLQKGGDWVVPFVAEVVRFTGVDDAMDNRVDCLAYAAQHCGRKRQHNSTSFAPYVLSADTPRTYRHAPMFRPHH